MASDNFEPPPGPPPFARPTQQSFNPPTSAPQNRESQRIALASVTSQSGHLSTSAVPHGSNAASASRSEADQSSQSPFRSEPNPSSLASSTYAMPTDDPPPYHDWTIIPDTALLPPPPNISYSASPATNANRTDADRGHAFTDANPLWPIRDLTPSERQALTIQFASIIKPVEFAGSLSPDRQKPGTWIAKTSPQCGDCCLLSSVPLYSADYLSPLQTESPRTIYFEAKVHKMGRDAGIAIGFVAPPYPTWRLPGWERASLGVHGDDGRRYVNDTWGGMDFTSNFKNGDTVGIGMAFKLKSRSPQYSTSATAAAMDVEVFFTRNGKRAGGWDLHEEVDAEADRPGGVYGLEGDRDLYAAIGIFGTTELTVVFGRHNWLYKPEN